VTPTKKRKRRRRRRKEEEEEEAKKRKRKKERVRLAEFSMTVSFFFVISLCTTIELNPHCSLEHSNEPQLYIYRIFKALVL
jgi:hypothetical protein